MTIWFTADHHFGHENIIKYCRRPFDSVQQMNAELVRRWNERVSINDTVYHLGDFTLGIELFPWIEQLAGNIKIVPGGHDIRWNTPENNRGDPYRFTASGTVVEVLPPLVSVEFPEWGDGVHPLVVVLCHYAMRVWDRSHYGALHLYGHSHGGLPGWGRSIDVGVDCHDFYPICLEDVIDRLADKLSPDSLHESIGLHGHLLQCPDCHEQLSSLLLCFRCGRRFELAKQGTGQALQWAYEHMPSAYDDMIDHACD